MFALAVSTAFDMLKSGGGEIFSAGMNLCESLDDFDEMREAPATGYDQFVHFDADTCFYVKTREGHYGKVKILNIQGDKITFRCAYRSDGKRSF